MNGPVRNADKRSSQEVMGRLLKRACNALVRRTMTALLVVFTVCSIALFQNFTVTPTDQCEITMDEGAHLVSASVETEHQCAVRCRSLQGNAHCTWAGRDLSYHQLCQIHTLAGVDLDTEYRTAGSCAQACADLSATQEHLSCAWGQVEISANGPCVIYNPQTGALIKSTVSEPACRATCKTTSSPQQKSNCAWNGAVLDVD